MSVSGELAEAIKSSVGLYTALEFTLDGLQWRARNFKYMHMLFPHLLRDL